MVTKMKNCPSCGRLYVPLTAAQKLCPDCMDKMREKEHEVVEYVRDHPKVIASAAAPKGGLGGTGKGPRPTNGERPSSFRSERDKQQPSKQSKRYRGLR